MLLFTPALAGGDPLGVLAAALPFVDVVQIRPKPEGAGSITPAREALEWARRALDLARGVSPSPLFIVDDRVDVAAALWGEGLAGVHLGQEDTPPEVARELLGEGPLIGFSTHDLGQVARAGEQPVDYLGFGPVNPTATKGYERGLGGELAWVASVAAPGPVFPIGGIDGTNVDQLAQVGRAAVGRAILAADDPGAVAAELRERLGEG